MWKQHAQWVIVATAVASITTPTMAEARQVTAPYPSARIDTHASVLYCDATVDTELWAAGPDRDYVQARAGHASIDAIARTRSDRIVIEIDADKFYLRTPKQFENDDASRDFPFDIIENMPENLVARATGLVPPVGTTVFTLDRKSGPRRFREMRLNGMPRSESIAKAPCYAIAATSTSPPPTACSVSTTTSGIDKRALRGF